MRRVIDRCQTAADRGDEPEQQDVNVLKLLYLIRYIRDIKANIDNVSILMIYDIRADKISLRASVTASLNRLLSQNYISKDSDNYAFLTDEEQDFEIDIKKTPYTTALRLSAVSPRPFTSRYIRLKSLNMGASTTSPTTNISTSRFTDRRRAVCV